KRMTTITFGKHQGSDITEIPDDYLEWGSSNLTSPRWKTLFQTELNRRKQSDPDKLFEKLVAEELQQVQREIANSGSEHEYAQCDPYTEAENRAKARQADQAIKELRIEYATLLGLDSNTMDMLENFYYNDTLSRKNFATEHKYNLAMQYFKKRNALIDVAMSHF
ncbi:MAG: hypothetical protein ACKPE3_20870, partial [Sphaerospermopsis kisseleviana]